MLASTSKSISGCVTYASCVGGESGDDLHLLGAVTFSRDRDYFAVHVVSGITVHYMLYHKPRSAAFSSFIFLSLLIPSISFNTSA